MPHDNDFSLVLERAGSECRIKSAKILKPVVPKYYDGIFCHFKGPRPWCTCVCDPLASKVNAQSFALYISHSMQFTKLSSFYLAPNQKNKNIGLYVSMGLKQECSSQAAGCPSQCKFAGGAGTLVQADSTNII